VRDIEKRLVYWTYPSVDQGVFQGTFPNRVLLYNYENESWAIFKDSITCYGYVWLKEDPTWSDVGDLTWQEYEDTWGTNQNRQQEIVAGNQQGYIHKFNELTSNMPSLSITGITGNSTTPTSIKSVNHNLAEEEIIEISGIPVGTPFENLNGVVFAASPTDEDNFLLFTYDSVTDSWNNPQLDESASYVGCGEITIRDNFRIRTKKFNHMEEGRKIQIGYVDALFSTTSNGQISFNAYIDYLNNFSANNFPLDSTEDNFFNVSLSTSETDFDIPGAIYYWQRVFCAIQGNFIQIEFTLDNAQMNGDSAISEVALHAMIVWERIAGRLTI
ncbi:MAG: hypothetical protein MUO43_06025, partial [Desulfobacterales bacterium]|nr:hypothetical protein [Desulfobacterales bacterium]